MNFLFVCGGSAGHINPAIAIATELRRKQPDSKILFVGADKILEKKLVPGAGFDLVNIQMSGLRRGFSITDIIHNIKTGKNLLSAIGKSTRLLKDFKPIAVIGTGGYVSYPVLKKAARKGIPTFVLEPNAYPGLAVRMLSNVVDKVFVTYKGLEYRYKRPDRVVYTGTPLRSEFLDTAITSRPPDEHDKPLVLSYWGSLGAVRMNEMIAEFIKQNIEKKRFKHIHAAGAGGGVERIKRSLESLSVSEINEPFVEIVEYIDDISTVMRSADIVISRAGASTIAELTALGKPAILVPSPNVTENHQEENAKQLQMLGGALMIKENECTGEKLYKVVTDLLDDRNELESMAKALKSLSMHNAAASIVDIVIGYSR